MDRRSFLQCSAASIMSNTLLTGCFNESPLASRSQTIACFGDSLTAGLGGTSLPDLIKAELPNRVVRNFGISGQTAEQIAARQGGEVIRLSVKGNAFAGIIPVKITSLTVPFLSTPTTNREISLQGTLAGVHCLISRTATGSSPNQRETYTVRPDSFTTQSIPADSIFISDESLANRDVTQVLWLGRNNTPEFKSVDESISNCIDYLTGHKRYLVVGVLSALSEPTGTKNYSLIKSFNEQLKQSYSDRYVSALPPTQAEMEQLHYGPTGQDLSDIKNGTFPVGLRWGLFHLNTIGYRVFANRIVNKVTEMQW